MPILWLILGGLGVYMLANSQKTSAKKPETSGAITLPSGAGATAGSGGVTVSDGKGGSISLPTPPGFPPNFPTNLPTAAPSTTVPGTGDLPPPSDPKTLETFAALPQSISAQVFRAYKDGTNPEALDELAKSVADVDPKVATLLSNKARYIRMSRG